MHQTRALLAVVLAALSLNAAAATLVCPELSGAAPVNACPLEDELKHTYHGYCSDSAKAYANQTDSCIRYEDYRAMKNVARWESSDGVFDGYVSCDLPSAEVKAQRASDMQLEKQGKLSKLVCSYPNGVKFTFRTKGSCTVANAQATCD